MFEYVIKKEIVLKDCLKHPKYNWPETLLTFPISFEYGEVLPQCWSLQDGEGNDVVYQVTDVVLDRGYVVGLNLHMICSLDSEEEKCYHFMAGTTKPETEQYEQLTEGHFALSVEKNALRIAHLGKHISYILPFPVTDYKQLSDGPLFSETEVICCGENEEKYTVRVKRIKGMPFVEIYEQMEGFANAPQISYAEISLDDMLFSHRYSAYRPVEKVDAYLIDGRLPITMMPFENWVSWFQSTHIAFLGEFVSAGFFIKDNLDWNDGTYPIWGSDRAFGIGFACEKQHIRAILPIKNGTRSFCISVYEGNNTNYIKNLWFWYALVSLNKVKDWVLEWDEAQTQYPMFFDPKIAKPSQVDYWHLKRGESVNADTMIAIIDQRSKSMNDLLDNTGPVIMREFATWTVITDVTAAEMSAEQFAHTQAAWAFMAYIAMDENYMPTRNMLSGHPNFLADVTSIVGFMAVLFPNHPQKKIFLEYFEQTLHKNLKHHIRPDVPAYKSLGGRETENLSTYTHAMLRPYIHVCELYELSGLENPLVCNQAAKLLNWLTNCLTAPVDGVRLYPPQGAHVRLLDIPYSNYQLAQMLEKKYPEQARNFFAACKGNPLRPREVADPFSTLFNRQENDYVLSLKSEKFTGYGYVLREKVGTPDEVSVHIQQLDEGPNYRWGTFENTGNGSIIYCAAGKRYSHSDIEDVGDRNAGAEEGTCGFAVLQGHTYHNIGYQDLKEPLLDFPMIKRAKLLAGDSVKKYYQYRAVSLIEADYIVLYDAVTHMRARGRFSWSVAKSEAFPNILQLKPGAVPVEHKIKGDVSKLQENVNPYNWSDDKAGPSKMIGYDGYGDFLTIVSHRNDISAIVTENGAVVSLPERTDYIFEDNALCSAHEKDYAFVGNSGYLSVSKNGGIKGAILDGSHISYKEMAITVEGKCALCFENSGNALNGQIISLENCTVTINGRKLSISAGRWEWALSEEITIKQIPEREFDTDSEFVRDTRRHEWGFNGTDFWEKRRILQYPLD